MAIRVVDDRPATNKYAGKCQFCNCEFEYLSTDIRYHRNYRNGFIYCPRCEKPFNHENAKMIEEDITKVKSEDLETYQLRRSYKKFRNLRNFFIIFGAIIGGLFSLVLFVMFTYWLLGLATKPNTIDVISYIYVALTGISMLIVGIVVFGNIAKKRLQQMQELETKKEE